jgi:hypothetical protein
MTDEPCWYQEMVELRKRADEADRFALELIRERDELRGMIQLLRWQMQVDAMPRPAATVTPFPLRALRSNWDVV